MANIELSEQKSKEQAELIALVNGMLSSPQFDWEYLKEAKVAFGKSHSNFDTLAAIHGQWSAAKSDLKREKETALGLLIQYFESLKKCNELEAKVKAEQELRNLFNY